MDQMQTYMRHKGGTNSLYDGVYGTKGIAAAANHPAARSGAVSWIDAAGRLWLFSGHGSDDLWQYDPNSKLWTWFGGSTRGSDPGMNKLGTYGSRGVADPKNWPGMREGSVGWVDKSGKFWLFGGWVDDRDDCYLNDLWQFDPVTTQWTWVSGSSALENSSGVYGTQGVAATENQPPSRAYAVSWRDNSGKFWLFGGSNGFGKIAGTHGFLSDLWQFDPDIRKWTWISGASSPQEQGRYGSQGLASANNQPGARFGAAGWAGANDKLWLFGGQGFGAKGLQPNFGYLNDLWQFDLRSKQWTWVSGPTKTSTPQYGDILTKPIAGAYGTRGVSSSLNQPGARVYALSWADATGSLWLFGGEGYDSHGTENVLNDLWQFDISRRQWTWVGGSPEGGVCWLQNCANAPTTQTRIGSMASTSPLPRYSAISWQTKSNKVWIFGGAVTDPNGNPEELNDLWVYQ